MCLKMCRYCGEMKEEDQFERGHGGKATSRCKACATLYKRKTHYKTESGIRMLLRGRVNSLRSFCEKHGLELKISVKKGEEEWT